MNLYIYYLILHIYIISIYSNDIYIFYEYPPWNVSTYMINEYEGKATPYIKIDGDFDKLNIECSKHIFPVMILFSGWDINKEHTVLCNSEQILNMGTNKHQRIYNDVNSVSCKAHYRPSFMNSLNTRYVYMCTNEPNVKLYQKKHYNDDGYYINGDTVSKPVATYVTGVMYFNKLLYSHNTTSTYMPINYVNVYMSSESLVNVFLRIYKLTLLLYDILDFKIKFNPIYIHSNLNNLINLLISLYDDDNACFNNNKKLNDRLLNKCCSLIGIDIYKILKYTDISFYTRWYSYNIILLLDYVVEKHPNTYPIISKEFNAYPSTIYGESVYNIGGCCIYTKLCLLYIRDYYIILLSSNRKGTVNTQKSLFNICKNKIYKYINKDNTNEPYILLLHYVKILNELNSRLEHDRIDVTIFTDPI